MNIKKWLITLGILWSLLLVACGSNSQPIGQEQQNKQVIKQQINKEDISQMADSLKKAQIEAKKQMEKMTKKINDNRKNRIILDNNAVIILYNDNYKTANFYIDSSIFDYPDLFWVKIQKNKNLDNPNTKIISDNYQCRLDTMTWKQYMVIECKRKDKIKQNKVWFKTYLFSIETKDFKEPDLYKQIKLYKTP